MDGEVLMMFTAVLTTTVVSCRVQLPYQVEIQLVSILHCASVAVVHGSYRDNVVLSSLSKQFIFRGVSATVIKTCDGGFFGGTVMIGWQT